MTRYMIGLAFSIFIKPEIIVYLQVSPVGPQPPWFYLEKRSQASMEVPPKGKSALSPGFSVSSTHAVPAQPTLEIHQPSTRQSQASEAMGVKDPWSFVNIVHKMKDKR